MTIWNLSFIISNSLTALWHLCILLPALLEYGANATSEKMCSKRALSRSTISSYYHVVFILLFEGYVKCILN